MPKNREHYVQVDKDLMDDPRLLEVAACIYTDETNQLQWSTGEPLTEEEGMWLARARYVAALLRLWCYADTYIDEDDTLPMSFLALDQYVGLKGFCKYSPPEWLIETEDGRIKLPGYCEKNNVVGRRKRRAEKAEYMRHRRNKERGDNVGSTFQARKRNVLPNTNTYTKEEKESSLRSPKKAREPLDDRKRQTRLFEAELTPGLNQEAWQMWLEYRREIRKALPTAGLSLAAHEMAALGSHAEQLDAVKYTMAQGWTGLQRRKEGGTATARAWSTRPTQESALAAIDAANQLTTPDERGDDGYIHLE